MSGEKFTLQINAPGFSNLVGDELIGFNFEESLEGCARWAFSFDTQDNSKYSNFIKDDESDFTFRFGTGMNTDGPSYSPLKSGRLLLAKKRLIGNGHIIFNLKGACSGVAIQKHRAKDKHWKDAKISDVVSELLSEFRGLSPKVESTEGQFTLMGCNQPTGKYISKSLLPLAYSQQGADWRFWVEDGKTVHFSPTNPKGEPYRFTNLFRSGWLKMKSPEVIKDTRFDTHLNTGRIEVVMYDTDTDRLVRREVDENSGNFNYLGSGRPVNRNFVSQTFNINMLKERQTNLRPDKLVQQVGRTIWSRYARSLYRISCELDYEPGISIGRPAVVDLSGPFGLPDQNTGNWLIHTVKHTYSRGDVKTWVVLEKRWER